MRRSEPPFTHPRDARVLVTAIGVSAAGDLAALFALALLFEETTGNGLAVAALFAANWLAIAGSARWAGRLVDRVEARTVLLASALAQALVAAAIAADPGQAAIYALVALLGAGAALSGPPEFALAPVIAGSAGLARLNARAETARYIGFAVGPIAGTALYGAGGITLALAVDAASFLAIAMAAAALRARRGAPGRVDATPETAAPRARGGFALLAADAELRLCIGVLVVSLVAMSASISADVFFVTGVLDAGHLGLGVLITAWTLGMVAGSLRLAPRVPVAALPTIAVLAAALQGASKFVAAALVLLPAALALYAAGGVAHGVKNVTARTLLHERVPAEGHGRAFAAYASLRNTAELLALGLGGALVELVGARATLLVAGGGCALIGGAGLLVLRARTTAAPLGQDAAVAAVASPS
jgi:hypothetical protein